MRKTILFYSFLMAVLILILKVVEYRFIIQQLSIEVYIGAVALLFTAVGIWTGWKITHRKPVEAAPAPVAAFTADEMVLKKLGISKREYEVLELMAAGLTNQEIADRLFLSLNTVKSHTSNLFVKLDVKRRTQAVQRAKELHLIA